MAKKDNEVAGVLVARAVEIRSLRNGQDQRHMCVCDDPTEENEAHAVSLVTPSVLPDEVKARGAFKFAAHPPLEGAFLTTQLWDRFNPRWRKRASDSVPLTPELERMLLAKAKELTEGPTDHAAAAHPPTLEQIEEASFAYKTARKVGKWRLF